MNRVTKILILIFCAVLTLSSCRKNRHTPELDDRPELITFTAKSQNIATKASTKADFPETMDFGVWGIARDPRIAEPYVLWSNGLQQITNQNGIYKPAAGFDAYWLKGYHYNFLAIAPYLSGVGDDFAIAPKSSTLPKDQMSFTYDMKPKYTSGDYVFVLMGAAAQNDESTSVRTGSQPLIFWNLFTKLCVKVSFEGVEAGTLTGMRLVNVDSKTNYTISLDSGTALSVTNSTPDGNEQLPVPFSAFSEETKDGKQWQTATVHVVPQDISDWKLFLDFEITTEDDETASTSNFEVNLANAKPDSSNPNRGKYAYNEWYNWNITISPKIIKFDVSVTPWANYEDENGDLNFDIQ